MPELPEVQTVVNDLRAAGLVGATITHARVFWPRSIQGISSGKFCRQIKKKTITNIWRRAKYIVFDLCRGDRLLIHLRMTGRLHLVTPDTPRSKHEHIILTLGNCTDLRLHDTRKFGRLYLVDDTEKILGDLGPEPLEPSFTLQTLSECLRQRKRQLKPLLLDQTCIAGLGNIYVDEALWEAKIHPARISSSLTLPEIRALHRSIPIVLKRGLHNLGTTLGTGTSNFYSVAQRKGRNRDQLNVFRRTGLPCPRCRKPVKRIIIGQRSTHICASCQKQ